jgi:hypothetical protein
LDGGDFRNLSFRQGAVSSHQGDNQVATALFQLNKWQPVIFGKRCSAVTFLKMS